MVFASPEKEVLPQPKEEKQRTHSLQHTPNWQQTTRCQRSDKKSYHPDAKEHCTERDVDPSSCSYITLEEKNSPEAVIDEPNCKGNTDYRYNDNRVVQGRETNETPERYLQKV
jgi:hypothetical protein